MGGSRHIRARSLIKFSCSGDHRRKKIMRNFCISGAIHLPVRRTRLPRRSSKAFLVGNDPRQTVPHLSISVYIDQILTLFCTNLSNRHFLLAKMRAHITYLY